MSETFSFIIALASVVVSCLNPLISHIIDHKKDNRSHNMKQMELFYNYKFSAYKDLIDAHAEMIVSPNHTNAVKLVATFETAACVSDGALQTKLMSVLDKFFETGFKITKTVEGTKETFEVFELPADTNKKLKECIELVSAEYTTYISKTQ